VYVGIPGQPDLTVAKHVQCLGQAPSIDERSASGLQEVWSAPGRWVSGSQVRELQGSAAR
jgi:hypothetical protein